jgi:hypothetical protein
VLPEKAEKSNRVIAYLTKTRAIDSKIVKALIRKINYIRMTMGIAFLLSMII